MPLGPQYGAAKPQQPGLMLLLFPHDKQRKLRERRRGKVTGQLAYKKNENHIYLSAGGPEVSSSAHCLFGTLAILLMMMGKLVEGHYTRWGMLWVS